VLLEAAAGAFQATFIFTGIVVIIFAILQHSGEDLDEITGNDKGFDPLALPEVNVAGRGRPRSRRSFGMAFGTFAVLVMLYFLRVGGLTLRFNLADPGEVIPVPVPWLVALIAIVIAQVVLQLVALLRGRWSVSMWLLSTTLLRSLARWPCTLSCGCPWQSGSTPPYRSWSACRSSAAGRRSSWSSRSSSRLSKALPSWSRWLTYRHSPPASYNVKTN
jgi:hypothetical protein